MTTAFLLYDLRRSLPVLGFAWAIITGFVLFLSGPLQGGQANTFQLLGMLSGMLLAGRLMSDTGKTQAYVFSRGITRRRVMLLRIVLGLAVIVALGALVWLTIVLGFRERFHSLMRMRDVIFYPMSSQFETSIIKPLVLSSISSFGVMTFYMIWRGLCSPSWNGTAGGIARLALMEAPIGALMLFVGIFSREELMVLSEYDDRTNFTHLLFWLPVGVSVAAMVVAWFASRDLEVG